MKKTILTEEENIQLGKKESLVPRERWAIIETTEPLFTYCKAYGLPAAKDERLERLEAAFIRYILESKGVK